MVDYRLTLQGSGSSLGFWFVMPPCCHPITARRFGKRKIKECLSDFSHIASVTIPLHWGAKIPKETRQGIVRVKATGRV